MTFDFSRLLPPEVAARLERSKVRVERLYGLPDRWLGREIAGIVRRIRASVPEHGVRWYALEPAAGE